MTEGITAPDYERAERELTLEEERRNFTIHAAIYVVINTFLIIFNLLVVPDYIWFYFPLLFWGFGLFMHYLYGVRRAEQIIEERQARIERRARQIAGAA
jgi:hypothetical protein